MDTFTSESSANVSISNFTAESAYPSITPFHRIHGTLMTVSWVIIQPVALLMLTSYQMTLPRWHQRYPWVHGISISIACIAFAFIFVAVPYCMCAHGELGIIIMVFGVTNLICAQIYRMLMRSNINRILLRLIAFIGFCINVTTEVTARKQLVTGLQMLRLPSWIPWIVAGPAIFHLIVATVLKIHEYYILLPCRAKKLQNELALKEAHLALHDNRSNGNGKDNGHHENGIGTAQKMIEVMESEELVEGNPNASNDKNGDKSGDFNPFYNSRFRLGVLAVHAVTMLLSGIAMIVLIWM